MTYDLKSTFLQPSGNVFVDQAQLTLKILLNKKVTEKISIQDILDLGDSEKIQGIYWISENINRFKSFSMLYGQNHPRTQSGFKPENQKIFLKFLEMLSLFIKNEYDPDIDKPFTCDICGKSHNLIFDKEYRDVLKATLPKYAEKAASGKEEPKFPCREFFPLAGSMGSESQSFSNMSISMNICPRCLFMVYYLPFSGQIIEGNLAIFQISDEKVQYHITKSIVEKYLTKIENSRVGDQYENVGKELKNKNELIFSNFLDLFKRTLSNSPTRQDFQKNYPDKSISYWLWKFTNSGQNAFLTFESIPNSSVLFIYLCFCLDLTESLLSLIKQETKDLKYSPKQIYNRIRSNTLYEFERLDTKKYHLNSNLPFLYYYYILNYSKSEIKSLLKIVRELELRFSNREDLLKSLKNRTRCSVLINQTTRILLESRKLSLKEYQSIFTFIPNSKKHKLSREIIIQMLKINISQQNFELFDQKMEEILINDALKEYNTIQDFILTKSEKIILKNVKDIYDYFIQKKFTHETIKKKIIDIQLKRGNISWFINLFANHILYLDNNTDYATFYYILELTGGWFNLKLLYQNILTAMTKDSENLVLADYEYCQIPIEYQRISKNPLIDKVLISYLNHRIVKQRKGVRYVLEKFVIPFIRSKISIYRLQNFLYEHAKDNPMISDEDKIDYLSTDWDELLINPKTGKQDFTYFTSYAKITIANYIKQQLNLTIEEKEEDINLIDEFTEIDMEVMDDLLEENSNNEEIKESEQEFETDITKLEVEEEEEIENGKDE